MRPRSGSSDRPESLSIDAAVAGTAGLVLEALAERRALEEKAKTVAAAAPRPPVGESVDRAGAARALKRGFSK